MLDVHLKFEQEKIEILLEVILIGELLAFCLVFFTLARGLSFWFLSKLQTRSCRSAEGLRSQELHCPS